MAGEEQPPISGLDEIVAAELRDQKLATRHAMLRSSPVNVETMFSVPDAYRNEDFGTALYSSFMLTSIPAAANWIGKKITEPVADYLVDDDIPGYDPALDPQMEGKEALMFLVQDSGSASETFHILRRAKKNREHLRNREKSSGVNAAVGDLIGDVLGNPLTSFAPMAPFASRSLVRSFAIPKTIGYNASLAAAETAIRSAGLDMEDQNFLLDEMQMAAIVGSSLGLIAQTPWGKQFISEMPTSWESVSSRAPKDAPFRSDEEVLWEIFKKEEKARERRNRKRWNDPRNRPDDKPDADAGLGLEPDDPPSGGGGSGGGSALHPGVEGAGSGSESTAGARQTPGAGDRLNFPEDEMGRLVPTGIGLEHIPQNPVIRLSKARFPEARMIAPEIVESGGLLRKENRVGIATSQSVETVANVLYIPPLASAVRGMMHSYMEYRQLAITDSDFRNNMRILRKRMGDQISGPAVLSQQEFRSRVGNALRNGDRDMVTDEASEYVEKAASQARQVFEFVGKQADDVGLFSNAFEKRIRTLESQLQGARRGGLEDVADGLQASLEATKQSFDKFRKQGLTRNTADSYFPRLWRVDRLEDEAEEFIAIARAHFINRKGLDPVEASKSARRIHAELIRMKPHLDVDEIDDILKEASNANPLTFDIPDMEVLRFLESDAEAVLRFYVRTMGNDIELTRRFGDISMSRQIEMIQARYAKERERMLGGGVHHDEIRTLDKELAGVLRDVRGLRDRLRGTYGAPKDPHRLISRSARAMKEFNVPLMMGGAAISSFPDIARIMMVEGMGAAVGDALRLFRSNFRKEIAALSREELQFAGEGLENLLAMRAAQMADLADPFGSRTDIERRFGQASSAFFVVNGLNMWNNFMKEWAGLVILQKMSKGIRELAAGTADEKTIARLHANGIDEDLADRITRMMDEHGETIDGFFLPNTASWKGQDRAMLAFRAALRDQVNRTIITPGAGDRALWTSTEFGSVITQFKSFAQASVVRTLMSGLQEGGTQFYQGAAMMVAIAMAVNEIKAQLRGDTTTEDDFADVLASAVDRSGVLGWFSDINNAALTFSDGSIGIGPDEPSSFGRKIGTLLGPSASTAANATNLVSDVVSGNVDKGTEHSAKSLTPGNNLPFVQPLLNDHED